MHVIMLWTLVNDRMRASSQPCHNQLGTDRVIRALYESLFSCSERSMKVELFHGCFRCGLSHHSGLGRGLAFKRIDRGVRYVFTACTNAGTELEACRLAPPLPPRALVTVAKDWWSLSAR